MIDRVYYNTTDEYAYASLDAALEVYGHKLQEGAIVRNAVEFGEFCTRYEYNKGSSDFHNGEDSNGRLSFFAEYPECPFHSGPAYRTIEYIGYTMLRGHQDVAKAEKKASKARTEVVVMSALAALPKQAYGSLRDPEASQKIREMLHAIEDCSEIIPGFPSQYEIANFIKFLKISYNLMGERSAEELAQLGEFGGD